MKKGYATLDDRLGVDLSSHARIVYVFSDAGTTTRGGLKAATRMIGVNNKPTVEARFHTEYVVTDPVWSQYPGASQVPL